MYLSYFKRVHYLVLLLVIGYMQVSFAKDHITKLTNPLNNLIISTEKNIELQLEVKETPLAQVLDTIANKTNVKIHYSALPEGLVTAICVDSTVKKILECLLDKKANLVVRNQDSNLKTNKDPLVEAWILGAKFVNPDQSSDCTADDKDSKKSLKNSNTANAEQERINKILQAAQSKDSTERTKAMSQLLTAGKPGDPAIIAVLEEGLTDPDDLVRAQAISSLAHREGNGALAAIEEAMHDKSVDVRMMAVDSITDNTALLQQALHDSDETIQELAAAKLEQLSHENQKAN